MKAQLVMKPWLLPRRKRAVLLKGELYDGKQ